MNNKNKHKIGLKIISTLFIVGALFFVLGNCSQSKDLFAKNNGYFKLVPMTIEPRQGHTATLLQDGRVLITGGGFGTKVSKTAEIYNPKTNQFKRTGDMSMPRYSHSAVLLSDGRVLITGGRMCTNPNRPSIVLKSAEIYDPKTGKFTEINSMNHVWTNHNMTLLNDGRVLISGISPFLEIYNPITNEFKETTSCLTNRCPENATLLNNGTVLLSNGYDIFGKIGYIPQIFDPKTETFNYTGKMNFYRSFSTATLLKNGDVVIIGGSSLGFQQWYQGESEIYTPSTKTFTKAAKIIPWRYLHSSIILNNGRVLVVGGYTGQDESLRKIANAELYDPQTDKFIKIPDMHYPRLKPTVTLLKNGNVLIISNGKRPEIYVNK